ncbi:MAG: carboxymuconolactone decarboxylase family protein [Bacillota bacterium]
MGKEEFDKQEMAEKFKEELGFIPPGISISQTLGEDMQEVLSEYHELIWRDEVIPLKYKYLIAVSSAIMADHEKRAKLELNKAIKNGATREEIIEVLRQVVWLKGAPTLVEIQSLLSFMDERLAKENEED